MSEISVILPTLLTQAAGGNKRIYVAGSTLREALESLKSRHPGVAVHLFDETGGFREHVLCFLNEINSRWLDSLDYSINDDDTITFLQEVSGG